MNPEKTTKRIGNKIPTEVENRIVEFSYQNPDFGAKRLSMLLKGDEIDVSPSSIYRILKRHGLQNRTLRISKIETRRLADASTQDVETHPADTAQVPLSVIKSKAKVEPSAKREPFPLSFREIMSSEKPTRTGRSFFLIVNLLLFALIGYLGFHAVQNLKPVTLKSDALASTQSSPVIAAVKPQSTPRPLSDYRGIWQRNLFNIRKEKSPVPNQNTKLNDLVAANEDVGLKLLGTVVTNDNPKGFAIIKNLKTAEQGIYHEEDKVGEAYVKKILRNKVVISIEDGDRLLTVGLEDFAKARGSAPPLRKAYGSIQDQQNQDIMNSLALMPSENAPPPSRTKSIRIEREEVDSELADLDGLMGQVRISPYRRKDQPLGFRISGIPRDSVLRKLGLRSRDVIKEINGQVITSPSQAALFFNSLSEGGELTIKLKRRRRDLLINLNIE